MFELLKIGSYLLGARMIYQGAKSLGMVPISFLSISTKSLDWMKFFEWHDWLAEITNPNSNFFRTINVGDGKMTVGWGLTEGANNFYPADCKITHYGQVFSLDQLQRMHRAAIDGFSQDLKSRLGNIALPQRIWDVLVSLSYGVGTSALFNGNAPSGETWFIYYVRRGEYEKARLVMDFWRSGGQVLSGLVIRRMVEHAIWLGIEPKSWAYYSSVWQQFSQTKDRNLL